jgi:hypothetical protein
VGAVLVAPGAILPPLHPLRVLPLVLVREEVAALALGAFEDDFVSGHWLAFVKSQVSSHTSQVGPATSDLRPVAYLSKLATGIEPVTSSLPRMRSTD